MQIKELLNEDVYAMFDCLFNSCTLLNKFD